MRYPISTCLVTTLCLVAPFSVTGAVPKSRFEAARSQIDSWPLSQGILLLEAFFGPTSQGWSSNSPKCNPSPHSLSCPSQTHRQLLLQRLVRVPQTTPVRLLHLSLS